MSGKILVCDDQEVVREVVSGFLERKGFEVARAKDGQECLELVKAGNFDAIYLDIKMPKMDGISVMKEIEKLDKKVQIILMSGFDRSNLEIKDVDSENTKFLSKPFALESVLQVLKVKEKTVSKVLVVDDQDMLREMLKDFLGHEGYEITEARNGKECVDCTKSNHFDAIFMDVRMPEMDGLAALHKLRAQGVKTPVFLMSGYGEVNSIEDAQKRGAQNFLPKPFRLEKALEMLNANGK